MTQRPIAAVLAAETPALLAVPGVVGTAIGEQNGVPCITVLVARTTPRLVHRLPTRLGGYPVVIAASGPIHPLAS